MQTPLNLVCRGVTYLLKCISSHHVRKGIPLNAETSVLKPIRPTHLYTLCCVKEEFTIALSWVGLLSINQPFGLSLLYFQPRNCSITLPSSKISDYLWTHSWDSNFQTSFSALGKTELFFFLRLVHTLLEKPENRNRAYFKRAGSAPNAKTCVLHPCLCEQWDLERLLSPPFFMWVFPQETSSTCYFSATQGVRVAAPQSSYAAT